MKIKLLFILLVSHFISFGQQNEMLVDTNKLWSNLFQTIGGPPPYIKTTDFIKFKSDTLINSLNFKKVYISIDSTHLNWSKIGYIREDSSKRVFYQTTQDTAIVLLYDFSAQIGDSLKINTNGIVLVVDSIDSVFIAGKYRRQLILSNYGFSGERWIDGIGSMCGVLDCGTYALTGSKNELLCYYESDILEYSNPNYTDCFYSTVGLYGLELNKTKINLFPNPVTSTSTFTIESKQDIDYVIEVYSMLGIRIKTILINKNRQAFINKSDFLSGLYLYRLISV